MKQLSSLARGIKNLPSTLLFFLCVGNFNLAQIPEPQQNNDFLSGNIIYFSFIAAVKAEPKNKTEPFYDVPQKSPAKIQMSQKNNIVDPSSIGSCVPSALNQSKTKATEITALEKTLKQSLVQSAKNKEQIQTLELAIQQTQIKLQKAQEAKSWSEKNISDRVMALIKAKKLSASALNVENSKSFLEVQKKTRMLKSIYKFDNQLFRFFSSALAQEVEANNELGQQKQKAYQVAQQLAQQEAEIRELLKRNKKKLLGQYKSLDSILSTLKATWVSPMTQAQLARPFGVSFDPQTQSLDFSKGIELKSTQDEVKSPAPGKIVYIGSIKGLGKTLIIQHDFNIHTVYTGLASTLLDEQQETKKNQLIARASRVDGLNQYGVYYELRLLAVPQDPLPWLKGIQ